MTEELHKLKLYPSSSNNLLQQKLIGSINVPDAPKQDNSQVETVIILDKSGSMGDQARRVTNEIIPSFLSKLSYSQNQVIHFITFDSTSFLYSVKIQVMKTCAITGNGETFMAPAVHKCQEIFRSFVNNYNKTIRLLTISDGEVFDIVETEKAAEAFVEFLKNHDFTINSQAVRLFTSNRQPDTRAIASLLQINNTTTCLLTDIASYESNEAISEKIANLFRCDNLANSINLTTSDKILQNFPWDSNKTSNLSLQPGKNIFWVEEAPINLSNFQVAVSQNVVKTNLQSPMTLAKFHELVKDKFDVIVDQIKINKVIGTDSSEKKVQQILEYFEKTEDELMKDQFPNAGQTHQKKISKALTLVVNDKNIKNLDQAQKAEYLRRAGFSDDGSKFGLIGSDTKTVLPVTSTPTFGGLFGHSQSFGFSFGSPASATSSSCGAASPSILFGAANAKFTAPPVFGAQPSFSTQSSNFKDSNLTFEELRLQATSNNFWGAPVQPSTLQFGRSSSNSAKSPDSLPFQAPSTLIPKDSSFSFATSNNSKNSVPNSNFGSSSNSLTQDNDPVLTLLTKMSQQFDAIQSEFNHFRSETTEKFGKLEKLLQENEQNVTHKVEVSVVKPHQTSKNPVNK